MRDRGYSSDEEKNFDYYYKRAREELMEDAWSAGPSKKQIRDRAAQLALDDPDVDYEEYQSQIRDADRSWLGGPWSPAPKESQLIESARSYLAAENVYVTEEDQVRESKQFIQQPEAKPSSNPVSLFYISNPERDHKKLNLSMVCVCILEFANKYLSIGFNQRQKYNYIVESLARAKQAFASNPFVCLDNFLSTRHDNKKSIKDAFEWGRVWSKSTAFDELYTLLKNKPMAVLYKIVRP